MTLRRRLSLLHGWSTEILIDAPQQIVWERVTDFDRYSEWNPFVLEAYAQFQVGSTIHFLEDLQQFGQHWLTAKFLAIAPPNEFIWQGHLGTPFLFSVRHTFRLEAISDTATRFIQTHENFGILVPFLALRGVYLVSYQGYLAYNQALKELCSHS
ncbi:MAG TPA: SRPBCC domain-containing protein [Cyanobacteria bacterium UBA8803]|nr:SRPBCC domain-containing protein [Cyanobacteria bacterium UBA9273]HBL58710.1 SRPBCC domain-containing protein [Cyanobacteria bacterium UBA8803]